MKMITIWTILFLMCLCVTVQAQWSGFPLASNTNRYEWENIRTNWIQLLMAADERSKAAGLGAFNVTASYSVSAGTTNIIGGYEASGFTDTTINHPFLYVTNAKIDGAYIGEHYLNAYHWIMSSNIFSGSYTLTKGTDPFADYYINHDGDFVSTNWLFNDVTTQLTASTWYTNKYTNVCQLVKSITMTNLNRTPYTYTDETGTHNATGFPYVTQAQQASLDAKITTLIPYFVDTNQLASGTFDTWFSNGTNEFPMLTKASVFTNVNVGFATNGQAYFTRAPMQTNRWLLAEAAYTGTWVQNNVGTTALRYYETIPPILQYTTTTHNGQTNAISSYDFTITGNVIVTSNQALAADSEVVTVTASNTPCTKLWHSISGITCATAGANTGDWVAVSYTNAHPVYGDAPYEIYALDFDERYKVLNSLVWSRQAAPFEITKYAPVPTNNYYGGIAFNALAQDWAYAKTSAEGGYRTLAPGPRTKAGRTTYGARTLDSSTKYVWFAYIIWESNSVSYVSALTNAAPVIALYNRAETNASSTNTVLNLQGDTHATNGYAEAESYQVNGTNRLSVWLGGTNVSTVFNWCDEPASNSTTAKGYNLMTPKMLLKWNVNTNGFKYQ